MLLYRDGCVLRYVANGRVITAAFTDSCLSPTAGGGGMSELCGIFTVSWPIHS